MIKRAIENFANSLRLPKAIDSIFGKPSKLLFSYSLLFDEQHLCAVFKSLSSEKGMPFPLGDGKVILDFLAPQIL